MEGTRKRQKEFSSSTVFEMKFKLVFGDTGQKKEPEKRLPEFTSKFHFSGNCISRSDDGADSLVIAQQINKSVMTF